MQIKQSIVKFIISLIPFKFYRRTLRKILNNIEINVNNHDIIFYDKKPLKYSNYFALQNNFINDKNLTIVMQGPIKYDNNFTVETIKLYNRIFKNCPIIVSTWDTEDKKVLEELKKLGCIVLSNSKPDVVDFANVNYQIKSTQLGLKEAYKIGSEYVIKTRTDQRMYETHIPEFLFNILKVFPLNENIRNQKERLVTLSLNTFKYRLYDISDMFLFGHIDDVIKFWDVAYEKRTVLPDFSNLVEYSMLELSEIGFTIEYLKKLGENLNFTLKNSWEMYAKYFCVIDTTSVGLIWPKYTNEIFRWRNFYGKNILLEELTFKEWLNLYIDGSNIIPDETIIKNFKGM